ncbi:MAG: replicative DNA helicase [Coriobacteriales bacterium]|nr:replicative DNA helicase [Coriobacteriales bacterium]
MPETRFEVNPTRATLSHTGSMPQDPEAEQSVLSAMLLSPEVFQECLLEVSDEDFYIPANRKIFQAMRQLFDNNQPVDPVTLADSLKSAGELERVGGMNFLLDLVNAPFALTSWRHHAEMLRRDSTLRQMIAASAQISALAFDAPEDTKEVVDQAERMLLSVTDRGVRSNYSTLQEIMEQLYNDLGEQAENQTDAIGVETGFSGLDERLLGLRGGQMVVVGARPGVGKTSFCLNLAVNAAQAGATVAFFSLEMSKVEIAQRLLSSRSLIKLTDIRSANIKPNQWPQILEATEDLRQLDILVDDTPGTTVTEIRAKARRMLHGREKGIVIIDYLQLLSTPPGAGRNDNRATVVGEMSRGIKIMAKDLDVPVVALSQLNREVEGRTGKRPQLSDLRESGSIEQDADIVILLDRSMTPEEAERSDRPDLGITQFIIAKNRSGPLAIVDMRFDGETIKFYQVDHFHEE